MSTRSCECQRATCLLPCSMFELKPAAVQIANLLVTLQVAVIIPEHPSFKPFSNLDSNIKSTIQEEIHKIIKETKTTTILVTHDIKDAFNISDKILIFKAGVLQQYDNPVNMYCNPVNCYCAKILGDLNQLTLNGKTFFIRPEKIKLTKKSNFEAKVEKSLFAGKEYKISANINGETWSFFSEEPLGINENIYLDFQEKDLLSFDSTCLNFFTN